MHKHMNKHDHARTHMHTQTSKCALLAVTSWVFARAHELELIRLEDPLLRGSLPLRESAAAAPQCYRCIALDALAMNA